MTPFPDDEEELHVLPGLFQNWREFLKALIVFAVCSLVWAGMIEGGLRLWHK
jgi:hypothetical protein